MVYYFKSNVVKPEAVIYVGKDKTENEELIKYGWEEDIWQTAYQSAHIRYATRTDRMTKFHADNLSSAHIYLRLGEGQRWDQLPKDLLEDCAQLTKANSIEGNKRDNVTVIYTPWSNLKKDGGMAVGQVGFHDHKKTKRILVPSRTNAIINRLNKTRTEIPPAESSQHLRNERDAHLAAQRKVANEALRLKRKDEEKLRQQQRDEKLNREAAWQDLTGSDTIEREGRTNEDGFDEDDFM